MKRYYRILTTLRALRIIKTKRTTDPEVNELDQEQMLQRIVAEYPEFMKDAEEILKANGDLSELLSVLDSTY